MNRAAARRITDGWPGGRTDGSMDGRTDEIVVTSTRNPHPDSTGLKLWTKFY